MKAEIALPKLKYSTEPVIDAYAQEVLTFVNKSYQGSDDLKDDFDRVKKYLSTCDITGDEFMIALNAVSGQKLTDKSGKPITYIRDINEGNFNLYVSAYLDFKRSSKQYEVGKEKLNAFLAPPEREKTPEELRQIRINHLTAEYHKLQKDGFVHGSNIFYELIKKGENIEQIKLSFVESFLDNFQPEFSDGKNAEGMTIIKKKDVKTSFVNHFVLKYIKKHNLKELSLEEFINYWEKFVK